MCFFLKPLVGKLLVPLHFAWPLFCLLDSIYSSPMTFQKVRLCKERSLCPFSLHNLSSLVPWSSLLLSSAHPKGYSWVRRLRCLFLYWLLCTFWIIILLKDTILNHSYFTARHQHIIVKNVLVFEEKVPDAIHSKTVPSILRRIKITMRCFFRYSCFVWHHIHLEHFYWEAYTYYCLTKTHNASLSTRYVWKKLRICVCNDRTNKGGFYGALMIPSLDLLLLHIVSVVFSSNPLYLSIHNG